MPEFSFVEKAFISKSGRQAEYAGERIPIVEVQNVYELGTAFFFSSSRAAMSVCVVCAACQLAYVCMMQR